MTMPLEYPSGSCAIISPIPSKSLILCPCHLLHHQGVPLFLQYPQLFRCHFFRDNNGWLQTNAVNIKYFAQLNSLLPQEQLEIQKVCQWTIEMNSNRIWFNALLEGPIEALYVKSLGSNIFYCPARSIWPQRKTVSWTAIYMHFVLLNMKLPKVKASYILDRYFLLMIILSKGTFP